MKIYTINFSPAALEYIGKLLDKQPYAEVSSLIKSMQEQITAQEDAAKDELAKAAQIHQQELIDAEIERRRQAEQQGYRPEPGPIPPADADVKGQPVEEPDQPAETLIEKGD